MTPRRVLFVTSEMAPWVKTGGLGDVAGALPAALRAARQDIRVLLPRYPALAAAFPDARPAAAIPSLAPLLPPARLLAADADGLPLLLLDCPPLYDRPGNPYLAANGHDWPDNAARFGLLSRVAALLGNPGSPLGWQPDLVHANDWQSALAPTWLREADSAASLVSVHNIAFQGCFPKDVVEGLGVPWEAWRFDGAEYHGQLSFLKAGLQFATRIATVSPTYAREIQDEAYGYGLAPLLRHRADALHGILNGIDTRLWDPGHDPALEFAYGAGRLAAKRLNRSALQEQLGLEPRDDRPLFGVVSRLTHQKGLDLLLAIGDAVIDKLPGQLVVLGTGEKELETGFLALAARHPGEVAVTVGFDETLAHRVEAGVDAFLMPSRFEPCGLNQMYSLAYGTPPIVRATGGLADTVVDTGEATLADRSANGFAFTDPTPETLWLTIERAAATWRDRRTWQRIQQNGMRRDFSWKQAATKYLGVYEEAVTARVVR